MTSDASTESETPVGTTDPGAAEATIGETAAAETMAALKAEAEGLRDQLLRTLAEMENLRRRTEREVQDANRYATAGFARDVLSVGDNLRRAIEAVPAEARAAADAVTTALLDGVEMTERELLKVLEKHGVRRIDPTGQRFDPNLHQAMFEVPNPDVVSGTVVQVLQPGYVIAERMLRPALVGVAKGGPKEAPKPAETADPQQGGAA